MTSTPHNDQHRMIYTHMLCVIIRKMTGYRQTKWLNSRLINNIYYLKIIIHHQTNYA